MSGALEAIITDAGRDAAVSAGAAGLDLQLTHIAVGTGITEPDRGWTALEDERERVDVMGGQKIGAAHLQITGVLQSDSEYMITQIGIFASDGTLFAVCWRDGGIAHKSPGMAYPISFDLPLLDVPGEAVTVNTELKLDLAFISPIAALARSVAGITSRQLEQELRLRELEGKSNGGMK